MPSSLEAIDAKARTEQAPILTVTAILVFAYLGILLKAVFGKLGHTTQVVEDDAQAVAAAAGGSYDIMLVDMQMPVMNGEFPRLSCR